MISKKAIEIPPFIAMEVLERAQELELKGEHIIHLEVGEPDFETPACIQEAARKALKEGRTKYTHSLGVLELREAICEHYYGKYRVKVVPEQVLVTAGTSPAMWLVFSALLGPGDEVILSNPYYACYPNFVRFAGGRPVFVEVREEDGFQFRPEAVQDKITKKTKGIFINSPANPTGTLLDAERMGQIANLGPLVLSDEIYHGLVYEGKEHSILEFTDQAIVFNGFSKAYAMTGWRLGYAILPREFVRPLQKMHQNFFISAADFVQRAGIAALKEAQGDVARMRQIYNERRRFIVKGLRGLGFGIATEPTGAFYVLANAKRFSSDSYKFAFEILEKAKVGVTPGIDFGSGAEGYIRFSYANSLENIAEALKRIQGFLHGKQRERP
ncbi:MAG: pyridoxal phosphate-dependent aminotransferase [candidate division NC10 bacterium]|nr:pyridoxal phosphate-dependent aminotransferase [candidate division NC10 bacterium]